jgi:dihydropyrimidinase
LGLLIQNGRLVLSDKVINADIYISNDKISRVEDKIKFSEVPADTELINAESMIIFPGFIDAHTHYGLGEGSDRTADGFFEGSRAAAFGGITTFIDFADQITGKTLVEGAEERIQQAQDAVIDFALHQGIYYMSRSLSSELDDLKNFGISIIKLFTTYKEFGCFFDPSDWSSLFPLCRDKKILITVHAENDEIIDEINDKYTEVNLPAHMHCLLRPSDAEVEALVQLGETAGKYNIPLYIVHLSSEAGLNKIRDLRNKGNKIIIETTSHYLFLTEEKLRGVDGVKFIMTPPLRKLNDTLALQQALINNEIEIVASDHCSFTPERKGNNSDCRNIPAGIPGSEEMASMVFSLLDSNEQMNLVRMGNLLSVNPAKYFGLYPEKGSLIEGTDADLVIFSPNVKGVFSDYDVHTSAAYTAYDGFAYNGKSIMTISRGKVIIRGNRFTGSRGHGRFLKSTTSSAYE